MLRSMNGLFENLSDILWYRGVGLKIKYVGFKLDTKTA